MLFYLIGVGELKPTVTIHPSELRVQEGTRAELHCTATGNPTPTIEWTGKKLLKISLCGVNLVLTQLCNMTMDIDL